MPAWVDKLCRPALARPTLVVVSAYLLIATASGAAKEVGPEMDWCGAIHILAPGAELVLKSGDYRGGCTIRRSGTTEAPIVIRSKDPDRPARITSPDQSDNLLNIRASHVTIRGIFFGPALPGVDAIRIYEADDVAIEECRFDGVQGLAIVANHSHTRNIRVRRNEIVRSGSTAMYFGCHDGFFCMVEGVLIEGNYLHEITADPGAIGYGIQIKLNSTAVIRDNVIVDTKGPGIMVYGATDPLKTSIVERNFVAGSRTSSAIVVGGGPAIVRNNIGITSAEGGIALENYGGRGLLRDIAVAHNTVYDNVSGGILLPSRVRSDVWLINNAAHARPGTPALPGAVPGVLAVGNADCTRLPCFVNPSGRDFSPLAMQPGVIIGYGWMPTDDYFGRARGVPPMPGAVETLGGAIVIGRKAAPR